MKSLIYWFDKTFHLPLLLMVFWGLFWLLNGADKFFNGTSQVSSSRSAVLLDADGDEQYSVHSIQPAGIYGVTRDAKMIGYFERIHLPAWVALATLYVVAILEVILGFVFLAIVYWSLGSGGASKSDRGMFGDRTMHRLAFKGSIAIFVLFCVGDILFGDRMELWEHGTFMILSVLTYDSWYRTDQFFLQQGDSGGDEGSVQAAAYKV